MIREATKDDFPSLDIIGNLISADFVEKNKLNERLNLDYVKIYVYCEEEKIKGFIEIEVHFEVIDIINIAVLAESQNKGIASSLLNYVFKKFSCERALLEVKEDNETAINFYKKNNFKEINRRKKYYNNLDAIIMERKF